MMQTVTVILALLGSCSVAAVGNKHVKRRAQTDSETIIEPVYCNSFDCPGGYVPIIGPVLTPCDYGICTVAQCCEAFCWGFPCPGGMHNWDNINEKCPVDEGCTADLCCYPEDECGFFVCPSWTIPIPDPPKCDGKCTVEQCCESYCWSQPCPGIMILNPITKNDKCPATGCTTELCCASYCWIHACSVGLIPNPDTINDQCLVTGCTDDLCCIQG